MAFQAGSEPSLHPAPVTDLLECLSVHHLVGEPDEEALSYHLLDWRDNLQRE
jgi:hypothetical protein